MSRAFDLFASLPLSSPLEMGRIATVTGCALALILAGQALPF